MNQVALELGLPDGPAAVHPLPEGHRAWPGGSLAREAGGHNLSLSPPVDALSRYIGNNCCTPGQDANGGSGGEASAQRRERKAGLREILRGCTEHEVFRDRLAGRLQPNGVRLGGCGTAMHGMSRVRIKAGTAFYSGVETCKSLLCPMCGARIRGRRAEEFTRAIEAWFAQAPTHDAWFVRLSARNTTDLPLVDGVARVTKGWQRLTNRRAWKRLRERYGLHYVKVREETHSPEHGWNVHVQAVITTDTKDPGQALFDLNQALRSLWPAVMAKLGYHADPRHSVDIQQVDAATIGALGGYLAKGSAWDLGDELAKGHAKLGRHHGRTYEQIVADFGEHGDAGDLALIHEYHGAMYGRRQCSWSEGFRDLLKLGAEQSDEELAGDEEPAGPEPINDLAVISGTVLYQMLGRRQSAGLLTAAESGGYVAVASYVVGLGYPPESVWPPMPGLTRRQPPREGGPRGARTDWGGERVHIEIAEAHRISGRVAACVCEVCR